MPKKDSDTFVYKSRETRIAIHYTVLHFVVLVFVGTWHCLTHRQYDPFSLLQLLPEFEQNLQDSTILFLHIALYAVVLACLYLFQWIRKRPIGFSKFGAGIVCLSISAICLLNESANGLYLYCAISLSAIGFLVLFIASLKYQTAISVLSGISMLGNAVLLFLMLFVFGYWIPFLHLILLLGMYVVGGFCLLSLAGRRFMAHKGNEKEKFLPPL